MFHSIFRSYRMYRSQLINKKCLFLFICVTSVITLFSFQMHCSSNVLDMELVDRQPQVSYRSWMMTRQTLLADTLRNKRNGSTLGTKNELVASSRLSSANEGHSIGPDRKRGTERDSRLSLLHTLPSNMSVQRKTAKLEKHAFSETDDGADSRKNTAPMKQSLDTMLTFNKTLHDDLNEAKHILKQRSVQTKTNKSKVLFSDEYTKLDEKLLNKAQTEQKNISKSDSHTQQNVTRVLCRKRLPDALIIGASKCGTGALAKFLSFHPDIAIIPGKEFNFFSDQYDMGFKWYSERMPCSLNGQLTVERSSTYFMRPHVPERIRVMSKWTKLILIVCEPVRRAISHFTMMNAAGKTSNMSFSEFLFQFSGEQIQIKADKDAIKVSDYSRYFPSWLKLFPFKRIHIVDGDNLSKEPYQELSAVEHFLDVGTYFTETDFVFNSSKGFFCFRKSRIIQSNDENQMGFKENIGNSSKFRIQNEPDFNQNPNNITELEQHQLTENLKHSGNIPGSEEMLCLGETKGKKRHVDVPDKLVQFLKQYYKPYNEKFYTMANRTFNW